MRRWTTVASVAAVAALTILTAAPANAAIVLHPSKVSLTNASGVTNGCVAKIPAFTVGPLSATDPTPDVKMDAQITCPAAADVHRLSFKVYLFEVRSDGTLRGMNGPDGLLGSGVTLFDQPLTGLYHPFGAFGVLCGSQYPQNTGRHTWLVRAIFHTRHSTTDPVPFIAQFDRQQIVNCH